jgi:hypothetical protein
MTPTPSNDFAWKPAVVPLHHDLLVALVHGSRLGAVVPAALELVDQDPLVSIGHFRGDVLRGLMEVPGSFWGRHPGLFDRYRDALRAAAVQRRTLPPDQRLDFWKPLELAEGENALPASGVSLELDP